MEEWNSPFSGEEIDRAVENGLHALRTDGATAMTEEQKSALLRQLMAVGVNAQEWSEGQKAQARRNIGAGEGAGGVIASATEPTDPAVSVWINTSGSTPVLYVRNTAGTWYPVPGLVGPAGPATGVNPNLLDNWYFGNPVNQRGQTSYSLNAYTIDRWHGTRALVEVGAQGVSIAWNQASGSACYIYQRFDGGALAGRTVTLSLLLRNKVFTMVTGKFPALGEATLVTPYIVVDGYVVSATLAAETATTKPFVSITTTSPTPIPLLAVKLELGDTQTLAHQDADGNWVINEIPDYGEQLARCQRYYQNVGVYSGAISCWSNTSSSASISVPLSVPMRAQPSLTITNITALASNTSGKTINRYYVSDYSSDTSTMRIRLETDSWSVGAGVFIGKITLTADL